MTPEAWRNSSLGYFLLLSLNTGFCFLVPQISNTLIFAIYLISPLWYNEYFIFPNAFQTSQEQFSVCVMTWLYMGGEVYHADALCALVQSFLMQISPVHHEQLQ